MSLAEYALPGADPDLEEPFASRLLRLLDFFAGGVMILSGRRSRAEQERLYALYLAGGNLAAKPGSSLHELGLAADLQRVDVSLSWGHVHYTAAAYGLRFPIPGEEWHCELEPSWVDPAPALPEVEDMTKEEFAAAIGAEIHPVTGLVCVPLINDRFDGYDLWPFAAAVAYTHEEVKRTRYGK